MGGAPVLLCDGALHEPLLLELLHQPAEIAGVETEITVNVTDGAGDSGDDGGSGY